MQIIDLYYYVIKALFFFSLLRVFIKFDPLKDHFLFMAVLYTAGITLLYWVYFVSWKQQPEDWQVTGLWLGETLALSALYYWLLARFDEGVLFWTLLLAGPLFFLWF